MYLRIANYRCGVSSRSKYSVRKNRYNSAHMVNSLKAAWQLGPGLLLYYAWYAFKLKSGLLRLQTPSRKSEPAYALAVLVTLASSTELRKSMAAAEKKLISEADEILSGKVRLFGTDPRPLRLAIRGLLRHWTAYTRSLPDGSDIKPVWEVGRFGWATVLARAYWLTKSEKYAEGFWRLTEYFLQRNPANLGPHWSSGQEVALRLIALAFCYSLLAEAQATTVGRKEMLSSSIAQHAQRIPPSLAYAQAQNNNHLLSEALGLWTAASLLPQHPQAQSWKSVGQRHFASGISRQVHADGAYAQHSANYHRLLLQLGTWAVVLANSAGEQLPARTSDQLAAATHWLLTILDDESGQVPNLGPNDGAYILPLTTLPFADHRPVLQAASWAFSDRAALPRGAWDELGLWLGLVPQKFAAPKKRRGQGPLRIEGAASWAYLRAAQFNERPGHADQLHLDLWWRGLNIAQDAGSYLYTAAAPWDNALASTAVHNTLMIDDRQQMTRASRFLWLDWAQAAIITRDPGPRHATAQHDGYRKLGLTHRRHVESSGTRWLIRDQVLGEDLSAHSARVHWLLPNWPWRVKGDTVILRSPKGAISVKIEGRDLTLVRAGKLVHGKLRTAPTLGWVSPTYGLKLPALSLIAELHGDQLRDQLTVFDTKPRK
jgi:hypothetical protein